MFFNMYDQRVGIKAFPINFYITIKSTFAP